MRRTAWDYAIEVGIPALLAILIGIMLALTFDARRDQARDNDRIDRICSQLRTAVDCEENPS